MKDVLSNIFDKSNEDTISAETEYTALREEKIFRYGYSNSVNTSLFTITLAVFSVGALLFTMSTNTFEELAKMFFPLFFLLPCLFARIGFYSLLRNSVRIGLLSEYMRSQLTFNDNISWEKIKKERGINYFLDSEKYIGGVKEVPICITAISLVFSATIAHYFIYQATSNLCAFLWISSALIPMIVVFYPLSTLNRKESKIATIALLISSEMIIYTLLFVFLNSYYGVILHQAIYHGILLFVLCVIPNFEKEIDKSKEIFKEYKNFIRVYPEEVKEDYDK